MALLAPSDTSCSFTLWGAGTEPKIWVYDCSDYLFKATACLKRMTHSLRDCLNEEISTLCLPCLFGKSISYNLRARLQEWERVSLWSLTVPLPARWVTGNAWVLIFSPVAAIGLKPLAGKRLKRGDKHINLPRPSPSAAASVPLCISRCSFSWTIRQNDVPSIPWWDVVQTFSLLSAGAGRDALRARGFACAGGAACFVGHEGKLGKLVLPTPTPLPSGLFREHPFFPGVLSLCRLSLCSLRKSPETN